MEKVDYIQNASVMYGNSFRSANLLGNIYISSKLLPKSKEVAIPPLSLQTDNRQSFGVRPTLQYDSFAMCHLQSVWHGKSLAQHYITPYAIARL